MTDPLLDDEVATVNHGLGASDDGVVPEVEARPYSVTDTAPPSGVSRHRATKSTEPGMLSKGAGSHPVKRPYESERVGRKSLNDAEWQKEGITTFPEIQDGKDDAGNAAQTSRSIHSAQHEVEISNESYEDLGGEEDDGVAEEDSGLVWMEEIEQPNPLKGEPEDKGKSSGHGSDEGRLDSSSKDRRPRFDTKVEEYEYDPSGLPLDTLDLEDLEELHEWLQSKAVSRATSRRTTRTEVSLPGPADYSVEENVSYHIGQELPESRPVSPPYETSSPVREREHRERVRDIVRRKVNSKKKKKRNKSPDPLRILQQLCGTGLVAPNEGTHQRGGDKSYASKHAAPYRRGVPQTIHPEAVQDFIQEVEKKSAVLPLERGKDEETIRYRQEAKREIIGIFASAANLDVQHKGTRKLRRSDLSERSEGFFKHIKKDGGSSKNENDSKEEDEEEEEEEEEEEVEGEPGVQYYFSDDDNDVLQARPKSRIEQARKKAMASAAAGLSPKRSKKKKRRRRQSVAYAQLEPPSYDQIFDEDPERAERLQYDVQIEQERVMNEEMWFENGQEVTRKAPKRLAKRIDWRTLIASKKKETNAHIWEEKKENERIVMEEKKQYLSKKIEMQHKIQSLYRRLEQMNDAARWEKLAHDRANKWKKKPRMYPNQINQSIPMDEVTFRGKTYPKPVPPSNRPPVLVASCYSAGSVDDESAEEDNESPSYPLAQESTHKAVSAPPAGRSPSPKKKKEKRIVSKADESPPRTREQNMEIQTLVWKMYKSQEVTQLRELHDNGGPFVHQRRNTRAQIEELKQFALEEVKVSEFTKREIDKERNKMIADIAGKGSRKTAVWKPPPKGSEKRRGSVNVQHQMMENALYKKRMEEKLEKTLKEKTPKRRGIKTKRGLQLLNRVAQQNQEQPYTPPTKADLVYETGTLDGY